MPLKLIIVIILVSLCLLLYIFNNIKKGLLSTKYALIWIFVCIAIIFFVLFNDLLGKFASFLGIETVSNMLFFFGFVFLIVITFNMTKNISKLNREVIKLTQEIGLTNRKKKNDQK